MASDQNEYCGECPFYEMCHDNVSQKNEAIECMFEED